MKLLCWEAGLPTTERFECCDRGLYIVCAVAGIFFFVVFHSFWPRNGHREIQPQEMNVCDLGFGQLVSGIFKGLVSHCVAATKISAQEMKMWGFEPETWFQGLVSHYLWPQRAAKKSSHRKWESGAWAGEIVLGSFQELAFPYLAAAGRQKIQPQEMRIRGLGLRNCFREFSGTCVPLSGRNGPPKNPATGNENPGLGLAKLF